MANITGFDPAPSGQQPVDQQGNTIPVGVWGDSNIGVGVFGTSGAPPPNSNFGIAQTAGVYGQGGEGPGVPGSLSDGPIPIPGVIGSSSGNVGVGAFSDTWIGLYAETETTDPLVAAVAGQGSGGDNTAGMGVIGISYSADAVVGWSGSADGVYGSTGAPGAGVHGASDTGTGVLGESFGEPGQPVEARYGVSGATDLGTGVYGASDSGTGVHGVSSSANGTEGLTFGDGYGVYGLHFSPDFGSGVFGESVLGNGVDGFTFASIRQNPDVAAVRGQSANGYAGLFVGRVRVTGNLSKSGGGFTIDHPSDPENRYLSHSFVESPDMMNVYSGTVTTDDHGNARVELPDYFEALNRDFRYQLTAVGQFAQLMVSQEINRNGFAFRSDVPRVKVCWQVTGVRQDAWAEAHRIPVEEDKPAAEKGRFLHPELFGHKGAIHRSGRRPAAAVTASLPEHLRPRAEQALSALQASGAAETPDLTELVSETRDWMAQRASEGRARLREERQRGEQIRERLRAGPWQKRDRS
jgi:hypothetical protein